MRKLVFEFMVKLFTGSKGKTERIMQIAFGDPIVGIKDAGFNKCEKGHYYNTKNGGCGYCYTPVKTSVVNDDDFFIPKVKIDVVKPKTKKDELLDELNYLKSKKNKSKQNKESIYTLEMVLKNMK
jgi:hypothetical protein